MGSDAQREGKKRAEAQKGRIAVHAAVGEFPNHLNGIFQHIDGQELMKDGRPAKFNADGIALMPGGDWLYYKPATDDKLYFDGRGIPLRQLLADTKQPDYNNDVDKRTTPYTVYCIKL